MSKQTVPSLFDRTPSFFRSIQDDLAHMLEFARHTTPKKEAGDGFFDQITTMPALDVAETDTAIEVSVEIPGVAKEDLDVTVQGDVLVIKGEKSSDTEEKEKDYHLVERRYGSFRRHVPLGFVPDEGAVSAGYDQGVLKLTIAKPENTRNGVQKIQIDKS